LFTEDKTAFFSVDELADSVIWTPAGGSATTIAGNFDNEYYDAGGPVGIEGSQPKVLTLASLVPGVADGDAITADGDDYTIVDIRPDGSGFVDLILEAQ
jgi:hypothetical protein